jgi:hypothetical protein
MRPQPKMNLRAWIESTANACRLTQEQLDAHLVREPSREFVSVRQSLRKAGIDLPQTRHVIQRFQLTVQTRWAQSDTLGFCVEAGARIGKHFAGLAYESKHTERHSRESRFTVHIEPTPLTAVTASTAKPVA